MSSYKKQTFNQLIGQKIVKIEDWAEGDQVLIILAEDGEGNKTKYYLSIDDEGGGGNDSHAYVSNIENDKCIIGQNIVDIEEIGDSSFAEIKLTPENGVVMTIYIIHDHNGYYGFCYSLDAENFANKNNYF